jgi:hypothetical protein
VTANFIRPVSRVRTGLGFDLDSGKDADELKGSRERSRNRMNKSIYEIKIDPAFRKSQGHFIGAPCMYWGARAI